jgi:hypothetical protein
MDVCLLFIVCCQVEVSATGLSLVQRSPTACGALFYMIKKPRERGGHSPRWAAEPEKEEEEYVSTDRITPLPENKNR